MGASVDPSSLRKTNETAAQSTQPHPLRTQASQKCGYWRCPAMMNREGVSGRPATPARIAKGGRRVRVQSIRTGTPGAPPLRISRVSLLQRRRDSKELRHIESKTPRRTTASRDGACEVTV